MASAQKIPQKVPISTSEVIPTNVSTAESSLLFVQRVIAVSISSVAFMRNVFDDESFHEKVWNKIRLRVLNARDPNGRILVRYLKGVYDAMSKGYLREMILGICTDKGNTENAVEAYTFKFEYKNGEPELTVLGKNGSDTFATEQINKEARGSTVLLLRQLQHFVETLTPVPEGSFFSMKLLYYDEKTPADYEPPGFERSETTDFTLNRGDKRKLDKVIFGNLNTKFHAMQAEVRSTLD